MTQKAQEAKQKQKSGATSKKKQKGFAKKRNQSTERKDYIWSGKKNLQIISLTRS